MRWLKFHFLYSLADYIFMVQFLYIWQNIEHNISYESFLEDESEISSNVRFIGK